MTTIKYREVADALRAQIQNGQYGPGDLLPSIRETVAKYGVTQGTAQTAYRHLSAEGWIVVEAGRGARVSDTLPEDVPALRDLARDVAELKAWRERHEAEHG